MSKNKVADALRLVDAATRTATNWGVTAGSGYLLINRMEDFQVHTILEERDFDQPVVVVGNWNSIDRWDNELGERVEVSNLPKRLGDALERIGVELAWSDCTTTCDDCYKLLNTEPTHYGWQPHYARVGDSTVCQSCLDPDEYLEDLEGGDQFNRVASIHPESHNYFPLVENLQRGFHSGMDADPAKIIKLLRGKGVDRFLFNTDDVSQFYSTFSLWVHASEVHKLLELCPHCAEGSEHPSDEPHFPKDYYAETDYTDAGLPSPDRMYVLKKLTDLETQGPSVNEAMRRGMLSAALAAAALPEGGVKYVRIDGDKVVEARTVSPEEFVRGIGKPEE